MNSKKVAAPTGSGHHESTDANRPLRRQDNPRRRRSTAAALHMFAARVQELDPEVAAVARWLAGEAR